MINGVPYVYEDHPYWDPDKKQIRHKREYIGKLGCGGEFIPNKTYSARQKLDAVAAQESIRSTSVAKRSYHGATYLLDAIGDRIGVTADLKACFPEDYLKILSIAYYLVLESDSPMYRFPKWAMTHTHPHGENLASQRISELLAAISETPKMAFFERQSQRRTDITASFSGCRSRRSDLPSCGRQPCLCRYRAGSWVSAVSCPGRLSR